MISLRLSKICETVIFGSFLGKINPKFVNTSMNRAFVFLRDRNPDTHFLAASSGKWDLKGKVAKTTANEAE